MQHHIKHKTYHRNKHEVGEGHISCHSRNLANVGVELLTYARIMLTKQMTSIGLETP